jgi:hypothetical protein
MIDYKPNLSKDDKAFIIKMSAVALISTLGAELIKYGMEELRNLLKKKEKPADPASKTPEAKTETKPEEKKP